MKLLSSKLKALFQQHQGTLAFVVKSMRTEEIIQYNSDVVFPSASMIKVPIMYEVVRQVEAGQLSFEQLLPIPPSDRVDGGVLQEMRPELRMSLKDLVTLMIVLSDNTATNTIIDFIGMDCVNQTMADLGLTDTLLQRKMMDFEAALLGRENLTSPADMALLYEIIYTGSELGEQADEIMLHILKKQQIRDKLPFYWPEEVPIAHKTGSLPEVEHDGGILYLPQGPYVACFFSKELKANYAGMQIGAEVGKVIYEHFTGETF